MTKLSLCYPVCGQAYRSWRMRKYCKNLHIVRFCVLPYADLPGAEGDENFGNTRLLLDRQLVFFGIKFLGFYSQLCGGFQAATTQPSFSPVAQSQDERLKAASLFA